MSRKALAGIIIGCTIAVIVVIVATNPLQPTPIVQTYTLTVQASPSEACWGCPSGGEYESGRQLEISVAPAAGYAFDHWSGDASGTSSSVFITMDSDKHITANFKPSIQTYTLTVTINPSGAGTASPPGGDFEQDAQIVMVATPTPGYEFSHWSGDISSTKPTVTLTMDQDTNVVANFEHEYVWMTPVDATASGHTVWGDTWYTGPPDLAIDGNNITTWSLNDMGEITFDLGSERLIGGVEAYWGGHVTNGNTVNVYVDGDKVLSNEQFGATSNVRHFTPVRGRFIRYQTVALPHNEYLQIAEWSEIAEFKVKVLME